MCFKQRPCDVADKGDVARGGYPTAPAELTGLLHEAIQWPRKKTGSVLRGLSFSVTSVISVGLSPCEAEEKKSHPTADIQNKRNTAELQLTIKKDIYCDLLAVFTVN